MSGIVHDGPAVYANADRSAVVDGSSPDAAFLVVGPNGVVGREFEALYLQHSGLDPSGDDGDKVPHSVVTYGATPTSDADAPDDSDTEVPDEPEPEPAPTPKPRKRTAKRTTSD